MSYKRKSNYTKEQNSTIRFNIIGALDELAKFNGVDITTIKNTSPYSYELSGVTSQKIAAEMKKLIDYGVVVKESSRGKTVKYMLRSTYIELMEEGKMQSNQFGFGDYRDESNFEDETSLCTRIMSNRNTRVEMW